MDFRPKPILRIPTTPTTRGSPKSCDVLGSPEDVLVTIEVNLVDGLDTDKIESVIETIEQKVKEAIPYVNPSKVYVEIRQDIFSDSYRRYRKMRRYEER